MMTSVHLEVKTKGDSAFRFLMQDGALDRGRLNSQQRGMDVQYLAFEGNSGFGPKMRP